MAPKIINNIKSAATRKMASVKKNIATSRKMLTDSKKLGKPNPYGLKQFFPPKAGKTKILSTKVTSTIGSRKIAKR